MQLGYSKPIISTEWLRPNRKTERLLVISVRRRHWLLVIASLLLLLAAGTYLLTPKPPARYEPSNYAALVPALNSDFGDYVAESRTRIRQALREYYFLEGRTPFLGSYTLDEVARMRAPFELQPASNCGENEAEERLGILMVHGLSDSPYLLRPIANNLAFRFPCALIRGLLMPGHGTVPGDLLDSSIDEWRATFDFGVESFGASVDRLVVLGYSNGATLSLDYLNRNPVNRVDGLILLAPGLEAYDGRTSMAPWLKWVMPWISEHADDDAVKYESFPTSAAGEFYRLTESVRERTQRAIELPSLSLISAEDTTINSQSSLDFYCQWLDNDQSRLLYFADAGAEVPGGCEHVQVLSPDPADSRFLGFSHVALAIPANDPHYGIDGAYSACLNYADSTELYRQCMNDPQATVYGENTLLDGDGMVNGKLLRRATFNPYFDRVLDAMVCFLEENC